MPDNPMQQLYLDKVVINIGIGDNEDKFQNAKSLLEKLTGHKPYATKAKQRVPELHIRQGQVIGAAVTLRGDDAAKMLTRALDANDNVAPDTSIANNSFSFGVKEYIYFAGLKYDPKIGMLGLNVNAAFARKGRRVEQRKRKSGHVGRKHREIQRELIQDYLKKNFSVKFGSD